MKPAGRFVPIGFSANKEGFQSKNTVEPANNRLPAFPQEKSKRLKMGTLLIKNAKLLITNDPELGDLVQGGIFVRDNIIEKIGQLSELPEDADEVIDARQMAVLPGLINTHHHFYQTLTRAIPGAQN